MKREEEIKRYCADNGFPYGACSSISSLKANIATEAIKWADKHPNGSLIKWQTGEPKEYGRYLVSLKNGTVESSHACQKIEGGFGFVPGGRDVTAWCKLSDIEPYREKEETK